MRETSSERRARLRAAAAADPGVIPHGTATGYDLYGCRCDQCRRSHADRNERYRQTPAGLASASRKNARHNVKMQQGSPQGRRGLRWTGPELDYLLQNRGHVTVVEMARYLDRTYYATMRALVRLDDDPDASKRGGFTTG